MNIKTLRGDIFPLAQTKVPYPSTKCIFILRVSLLFPDTASPLTQPHSPWWYLCLYNLHPWEHQIQLHAISGISPSAFPSWPSNLWFNIFEASACHRLISLMRRGGLFPSPSSHLLDQKLSSGKEDHMPVWLVQVYNILLGYLDVDTLSKWENTSPVCSLPRDVAQWVKELRIHLSLFFPLSSKSLDGCMPDVVMEIAPRWW